MSKHQKRVPTVVPNKKECSLFRCLSLVIAFLVCLPLVAASQGTSTKEITIPLGRMIALANAIGSLDGPERIIKDGTSERIVKDATAYKFGPGFRSAMSRNLTALGSILDGYNKEISGIRAAIAKEAKDGQIKDGSPELAALNEEHRKLLLEDRKANLFVFQEAELKLDANPIPISVLSGLEPIIEYPR